MSFLGTVIVGVLAFAGTYISNHKSNAIWQYRVQQLEEKQDKNNNIIERTYKLEKEVSDIKTNVTKIEKSIEKASGEIQALRETEVRIETQIETYHGA